MLLSGVQVRPPRIHIYNHRGGETLFYKKSLHLLYSAFRRAALARVGTARACIRWRVGGSSSPPRCKGLDRFFARAPVVAQFYEHTRAENSSH